MTIIHFSAKILPLACILALVGGAVNSDPSQAPAICAALGSNDVLVAHEDCSKFYICSWGKPVARNCPKQLLYNPEKEYCDWPANVNCNRKVNTKGEEDQDTGSSGININEDNTKDVEKICAEAGESDIIRLPHEECSKFYACMSGEPVVFSCAYPLVYNIETQVCDWPSNVDCGNRT